MKKNLGTVDRAVRLLLAAGIILAYVTGMVSGTSAILLGAVALLLIVTSMAGFCPVYPLLKISTISKSNHAQRV